MREPQGQVHLPKVCYYCGSFSCQYAHLNNGKEGQTQYLCEVCSQFFTIGSQYNRHKGRKYDKRGGFNVRALTRVCPHCEPAKDTPFKYDNNKDGSNTYPRFYCLRCKKSFQMRLVTNGTGRHLEHSRTRLIKPPKIAKGSVNLKPKHVKGLPYVDKLPSKMPENAAKKTSLYRLCEVEEAVMTDDGEDNMIILLESYQRIVDKFPALDFEGSLKVPETDNSFASVLEEVLLEDAEAEQNHSAC